MGLILAVSVFVFGIYFISKGIARAGGIALEHRQDKLDARRYLAEQYRWNKGFEEIDE